MTKLRNKLKNTTAETLLETLVSILIATMSVTLLTTAVMASARMNSDTAKADAEYNEALRQAECFADSSPTESTVKFDFPEGAGLTDVTITVNIYGDEEFASYKK